MSTANIGNAAGQILHRLLDRSVDTLDTIGSWARQTLDPTPDAEAAEPVRLGWFDDDEER